MDSWFLRCLAVSAFPALVLSSFDIVLGFSSSHWQPSSSISHWHPALALILRYSDRVLLRRHRLGKLNRNLNIQGLVKIRDVDNDLALALSLRLKPIARLIACNCILFCSDTAVSYRIVNIAFYKKKPDRFALISSVTSILFTNPAVILVLKCLPHLFTLALSESDLHYFLPTLRIQIQRYRRFDKVIIVTSLSCGEEDIDVKTASCCDGIANSSRL
ncbi:hypothetical protein SCHPADRAFT_889061 [Schizopora paradoxa]|uniref:Uncharacterized protein n=1 Tax=Schizopora paradoxa TaxID=27342 RepID=A0A0H2RT25_9AGAM|nr:hypothetical protein SCHPADRAFT_889061 [Schizopora paradoxa]